MLPASDHYTSVYETCAQGVTTNVNDVRQDRDEDDNDLLLFARLPCHAKVSSSVCVQPQVTIFSRSIDSAKSFCGALGQDVLAERFPADRHALNAKIGENHAVLTPPRCA